MAYFSERAFPAIFFRKVLDVFEKIRIMYDFNFTRA